MCVCVCVCVCACVCDDDEDWGTGANTTELEEHDLDPTAGVYLALVFSEHTAPLTLS